ncbi:hypothetical protein HMPREF3291_16300 [Bacillus sp. HMSC76G11]|nr:hypothetical protein HMPREF3291_16300 [Bacillus sp. HMSC76G11]
MNLITVFIFFTYLIITVLWMANSSLLFSEGGIAVWILTLLLGGFVYRKKRNRIILVSACFMTFLLSLTILIELITSSMP